MTRHEEVRAAKAREQEFADMQEADLMKYLRATTLNLVAAVDRLEALSKEEDTSAGRDSPSGS